MKIIWKYRLVAVSEQEIEMPLNSEILSMQSQGDGLYIWVLVNSDEPAAVRKVLMILTGKPVATIFNHRFIGTVQFDGLVFHFFDGGYKIESE